MSFYTFLPKLLNMSLTGAIAIICVLLLRLLLKRAPKVISYALWIVVLFRLLCPVSITSDLSLFGLLDAPSTSTVTGTSSIEFVPENIVHTEYPEVAIPVPGVGETINNTLPQGQEQLVADPLEAPVAIGTYVWLLGVMGMAVYSVLSYARLKRKLLIVSPLQENIWLADEITTPFVMGLIRPRIYLPSDTEERQMPYLILHEKHHIRRGDHIFKALAFLALSIHWFNPLVWMAFVYANKDMEMSCDEAVVKKLGDHILSDYTASLLSLATGKTIIAGIPLAFGEGDTKGRIRNLAHWKKPAFWVILVAVIACIALGIGLLTNPEKEAGFEEKEDGYYLLIGVEGVESIEVATANTSGGVINADGSLFRVGEKVWLEQLQGVTDLRGVSITVLGAKGEIVYSLSVPENASAEVVAEIVGSDPWLLVPTTFEIPADDEVEENGSAVVKWTFSPMMSATWHAAFCFEFGLEHYTHIEATCDNGKLWNLQAQGQPREKEMRFEQGESLCWTPEIEGGNLTDTAESAKVIFTVFDGEEIVSKGVLDIVRTGEENGQSFYEAQLKDTELLALWQEEGSNSAHVIMAGNGSIVSYSDLNDNRINENFSEDEEAFEELVRVVTNVGVENAYPWNNTVELKSDANALIKMASDETGRFEIYGIMSAKYGTYGLLLIDRIDGQENWNFAYVPWVYTGAPSGQPILEPDGKGKYIFAYIDQYEDGVPWWEECILDCGYDSGHMELLSQDDAKMQENTETPVEEIATVDSAEISSIVLINGNTGERMTIVKDDAITYNDLMKLYGQLDFAAPSEENTRVGYQYSMILQDAEGNKLHSITPYKDGVTVDNIFYRYDNTDPESGAADSLRLMEYLEYIMNTEQSEIAVNTLDNVSMSMIKYKSWEGELEIVNHTGTELLTGQWYELQKLEDGVWQRVKQRADGMWEDVGYRLPTGETTSLPTNWTYLYGELSKGKYRIIKKVDVPLADRWDTYYLATEFDIL